MDKAFERKLDLLLSFSRSWDKNALFNQTANELIAELAAETQVDGADPDAIRTKLGGLQGCIAAQENWLWVQGKQIEQGEATTPRHYWAL